MSKLRRGIPFVGVLIALVIACSNVPAEFNESVAATVNKGPGTRVTLADAAPFRWERVCIFGRYTSDADVDAATGIQGAAKQAYDIRSSDSIDVLMFIDAHRVAASIAHQRSQGDFGPEIVDTCYQREQAVFSVRNPPAGSWGNIGP